MSNTLYYGDNLGVLWEYVPGESVFLDPPLSSNVLFREKTGEGPGG